MKTIRERMKKKIPVIEVDEQELLSHVPEVVRQSVEETLSGLLEAEADACRPGVMNVMRNVPAPAHR